MAPFLSGGGYSSEAWSYITAIHDYMKSPNLFRLGIEQHGDLQDIEFWEGLSKDMQNLAIELYNTQCRMNETIVICHSEPGAWYPPMFQTLPCPPTGYAEPKFVIGRTMFETDRVNLGHVERINRMDSVWVPTDFHVSTFIEIGVEPSKVVKVVQSVDVKFFDPSKYKPLDITSQAKLVLGSKNSDTNSKKNVFVFLSIFKWEFRKGWDVLLKAYLREFSKSDGVALYLLTNPYHSDRNFGSKIVDFVEDTLIGEPLNGWAPIYVIDTHIAQVNIPRIYRAADAFVLPSRGEGWGRPLVEAMAMSLPVIATNWSGPTEYLTKENSYPLSVDGMSEVKEGPFKGHQWAEPSVEKLQGLMRHVTSNPEEAKGKGAKAREDMINRFSPEIVAGLVVNQIMKFFNKI
ncbi:Udp-glycosyltransferase superfamily protein [Thalictrum thalictroides]|uniref:Udp-glycosyltransferase superfamily protein n=1 Tax=Thalictrum thalictroides TaxID=46969 RepID=A0A7J6VJU9_THATH|nr:Udp-glycosyltransferase superfamily protein [Thalictrum thalictroides]